MSANTETTGAVKVGDVFERVTDIDSHRRAGSQFTIEEVDDEYAHWERRLHCLRPKHLLDETRYKRVVAPPIAAPALEWSFTDKEGRDHWFAAGVERDTASRAYWSWMAEQTGKPYAGPERLPKPQLAADWAWDCLPESDR